MTEYFEINDNEQGFSFEIATYHFGRGKFIKNKSHIAQNILESFIEMKDLKAIYIETQKKNIVKLTNLIKSNQEIKFDFDCNLVLESTACAVVTGDLKSLSISENRKIICAITSDSSICLELK